MHPDHRSGPKLKRLWAADTSGATHQISNDPSHRFHRSGRSGQLQVRVLAIGPKLMGASKKLPNHHAGTASAARLADQCFQTQKDPLQLGAIGKLQRLAGKLVAKFTHGSAYHFSLSRSPIALQLADEMKMAQLRDPASARGQGGGAPNLVGDQGLNAFACSDRNSADALQPVIDLFPTGKKQRIEENRTALMTRLQGHQIQHPRTTFEAKVKAVDQKNQWPWQLDYPGAADRPAQELTKTVTEGLWGKTSITPRKVFQRPALQERLRASQ